MHRPAFTSNIQRLGSVGKINGRRYNKGDKCCACASSPRKSLEIQSNSFESGNVRSGGCSAGIVNIYRMFPKGRHTMNAKMMSHLKDLGITLSL